MSIRLLVLPLVLLTGCFATTSHRLDAPASLKASEGSLIVETRRGDTFEVQAPYEGEIGAGRVDVHTPLLPRARFDADEVVRVETRVPQHTRTGLLVGGAMVGVAAVLAGCIALSVEASQPLNLGQLPALKGPLY